MSDTPTIPVNFSQSAGFEFSDLDGMFRVANCYLQSGFAPESFKTPQQLIICWARGAELGLRPLQSVEGLTVINNRIGIMGDVALGLVRASGLLDDEPEVEYSGEVGKDNWTCTVTVKRKGTKKGRSASFSLGEARQAGLLDRASAKGIPPWKAYPKRMLYYRPLGFILRDTFSDVLKGLPIAEELRDIPSEEETMAEKVRLARVHTQQIAASGVTVLGADQAQPSPADTVEPAFAEDRTKTSAPPFAEQLARDYPAQAAQPDSPEPEGPPATPLDPDDLSFDAAIPKAQGPVGSAGSAPERPAWMDHIIRAIPHVRFFGRKISELDPKDLGRIETQWIPQVESQLGQASEEQKLELPLFKAAIAYRKSEVAKVV